MSRGTTLVAIVITLAITVAGPALRDGTVVDKAVKQAMHLALQTATRAAAAEHVRAEQCPRAPKVQTCSLRVAPPSPAKRAQSAAMRS